MARPSFPLIHQELERALRECQAKLDKAEKDCAAAKERRASMQVRASARAGRGAGD